jgi:membrane protease YdiL (CAAX protease family)
MTILEYLSISFLFILELLWLPRTKIFYYFNFKWKNFSIIFYIGLFISLCYSIFILTGNRLYPIQYWPPVIILSILNAVIEELIYRLVFFHILKKAIYSIHFATFIQALFYSIPHFFIDPTFGFKALIYGTLLGYILTENNSIIPCIICHFVIDIGVIGVVMMVY